MGASQGKPGPAGLAGPAGPGQDVSTPACLAVASSADNVGPSYMCRGDSYGDAISAARWAVASCSGADPPFTGCIAPPSAPSTYKLPPPGPGVVRLRGGTCQSGVTYWAMGNPTDPVAGACMYAKPTTAGYTCQNGESLCAPDAFSCTAEQAAFCTVEWSKA